MDTDDLIDRLVTRHRAVDTSWIERRALAVSVSGVLAAAVLLGATLGFRHDLLASIESGRIIAKYVFILTMLVISGHLFMRLARPGRRLTDESICYSLPLAFIVVAALIQVTLVGAPTRSTVLGDQVNWLACIIVVPILAIVPFAGLMLVLRRAAPTDLPGAGFTAGVFAAAIAATVYASHCPCDTPVFVAIWYSIAFLTAGGLGAMITPRVARW